MLTRMLWAGATVLTPLLGVILVVGIVISVLQVATQVQEMTLSFVPKLVATGLMLILTGGWMMSLITRFARDLYLAIPSLAH